MNRKEKEFLELSTLALNIPGTAVRKVRQSQSYERDMEELLKLHGDAVQTFLRGDEYTSALDRLVEMSCAIYAQVGVAPPDKLSQWQKRWTA